MQVNAAALFVVLSAVKWCLFAPVTGDCCEVAVEVESKLPLYWHMPALGSAQFVICSVCKVVLCLV